MSIENKANDSSGDVVVVVVVVVVELFIINDLKRRAFIMKIVNGNVHYH